MKTPAATKVTTSAPHSSADSKQLDLFNQPRRRIDPIPPARGTKAWLLLRDMLEIDSGITQIDWLSVMGRGWRLAAAVKELRYLNWPIVDTWVKPGNSGYTRIKRYELPKRAKRKAEQVIRGSK